MDDSSVEEEIKSIKSEIKSIKEEMESVKSEIKSIKSMLGITSENVVGNTNHSQYDQLQNMLSTNKNVLLTAKNMLFAKDLQLNELYKLLLDMREEARGESFVMGGYNQLLQPYNLFAELVLTSYTWTSVHCYLHIAKQFHALT